MKWILGAVALLTAGLMLRLNLLVYAMYVLLGVLVLSRVLARLWVENLVAARTCDERKLEPGQSVAMRVDITNRGVLPVSWVLVEDSLPQEALQARPPHVTLTGERIGLLQLRPGGTKSLAYQVQFHRRGYYQLGPLLLETGDLFGLHRRYRVATLPAYVLVLPRVVPLEGYDIASRRPMGEIRLSHRAFEDTSRMNGIRQYVAGDAFNRIHWRATARTGTLHCKTFEPSCIAGATLLLDFHRDSYAGEGAEYRGELAITAVASVANTLYELGQQFGLATNGRDAAERVAAEGWRFEFSTRAAARRVAGTMKPADRLRPIVVETGTGEEHFLHLRETLARVEWNDGLTFAQLVREVEPRLARDATVIALLPRVTEETAFALGALQRGGFTVLVVMVTFADEEYRDWAEPPEWAAQLLAEGIEFRWLNDEAGIASLCAAEVLR